MLQPDWEKFEDRRLRARKALEYYVKEAGVSRPMPDKQEDGQLNKILDNLARDLVELAAWFSESASWMNWASKGKPPYWAIPFLTEEELKGAGLFPGGDHAKEIDLPTDRHAGPEDERRTAAFVPPRKKKGRRKKERSMEELQAEFGPFISAELMDHLVEHYDELPTIDHTTGGPAGEVL